MSALPIETMYPLIRPWCKRVTIPGMNEAIIEAARDLCLRSKFRRYSVALDILPLTRYYMLNGGNTDEEVVLIEAAQYNNGFGEQKPLTPIQPEQQIDCPNNSPNNIYGFWLEPPSQIALANIPQFSMPLGLFVRCVLQPLRTATTLDSMLLQQCDRTIAYGALARLLRRGDEPYTDYTRADEFDAKYEIGVGKAIQDVGSGFQPFNMTAALYRY